LNSFVLGTAAGSPAGICRLVLLADVFVERARPHVIGQGSISNGFPGEFPAGIVEQSRMVWIRQCCGP